MTKHHERMSDNALAIYNKLPRHIQIDIDDALESNQLLKITSASDVLDAWLNWNGIIGFGYNIMDIFNAMK